LQGRRVRYATTAQLVSELAEATDNLQLSRVVARYGRLDLLLLDEPGFVQARPPRRRAAVPEHHRTRATSLRRHRNQPAVQRTGNRLSDPRIIAAIVDRVTFNACILETGTHPYRLAASKTAALRKRGG
jgi:DNA replication protein DnaC